MKPDDNDLHYTIEEVLAEVDDINRMSENDEEYPGEDESAKSTHNTNDFDDELETRLAQFDASRKARIAGDISEFCTLSALPRNELCEQLVRQLCYIAQIIVDAEIDIEDSGYAHLAHNDSNIQPMHILLAIYLCPSVSEFFGQSFDAAGFKLKFPDTLYAVHDEIAASVSIMEDDLEKAKIWYRQAYKSKQKKVKKALYELIENIPEVRFDITSEDFAKHLVKHLPNNADKALREPFADWVELNAKGYSLSDNRQLARSLHDYLHQHVKGQPQAIRAVVNHEVNRSFGGRTKLRGLFTFVGPSGVGKTELAKRYAEAICNLEGTHYQFQIFNMEQYADEKSFYQLTGPGKQYSEAAHGELTQLVKFNPRSIIVFDEIEKAHHIAIQSLLTLLDSGYIVDNSTGEVSDFSQCIIIFTSNLGASEFAAAKGIGNVDMFDVLANSSYNQGSSALTLTPEFINRLRSGTGVRFKSLNTLNFFDIAAHALQHYQNPQGSGIRYQMDESIAGLLALSKLPDISARAIPKSLQELIGRISVKLFDEPELTERLDQVRAIKIDVEDDFYSQDVKKQPICFIGGSDSVAKDFDDGLSNYELHHFKSPDDVEGVLNRIHNYDAIVFDGAHIDDETLQTYTAQLADPMQTIPTILLGHANYTTSVFDAIWKFVAPEQITDKAMQIQRLLEVSWRIRHSARRNLKLDFSISYSAGVEDVVYKIHSPRYSQLIDTKRVQRGVPGLVQERPSVTLKDVIGLQRAKLQLARSLKLLSNTERLKQEKIKMPAGIVLTGPPGTGKTMLAKAVAGETQLKFLSLNVADLSSMIAGGSTEKIKELFEAARDVAPAIIFIDEIDALAARRTNDTSGSGADRNGAVNALLSYLDGLHEQSEPVFVIAATNNPEILDPALVRPGRLDTPVMCDLPDVSARKEFLKKFAADYQVAMSDDDTRHFASLTMGLSGAEMEKVFSECRTALLIHSLEEPKRKDDAPLNITIGMIREAIATARFGNLNDGSRLSEHARKITAWHEAGHLVALKLLTPDTEVPFATIEPRNQAQGFIVSQRKPENGASTKKEIEAQIAIYMAGREGERLLGDDFEITAGASHDIKMATYLATQAVCEQGLDEQVGHVNLQVLINAGVRADGNLIEQRIQQWLQIGRERAMEVLKQHHGLFEQVAETLFKQESLYADEIERLFNQSN